MEKVFSKKNIIKAIKRRVLKYTPYSKYEFPYKRWYCGITSDIDTRFDAHKKPELWKTWKTTTPKVAKDIEKKFQSKPYFMKGNTGGVENPTHVYIYRDYKPRITKIK